MSNTKGPRMYDKYLYQQAGIDPITGLPDKASKQIDYKCAFKKLYRIRDEQDAINRYSWFDLPDLTSQELERLIYYKGQLCMFYEPNTDKFYYMPYALDGTIDFYGRYNTIHPVPFASGDTNDPKYKSLVDVLSTIKLKVYYDVPIAELTPQERINACVIIKDYTPQLAQTIIPRQELQDDLLDIMAECMPMMRTALRNSTGVNGLRVSGQEEIDNVVLANNSIDKAVLQGKRWIAMRGNLDFQDLANGSVNKAEEFMSALQSMDNFRLSLYGLETGGLFQKKAHMLQSEQLMNSGIAQLPLTDGLNNRQRVCDIANALWGVGMSCEISESAIMADTNMDGLVDNSLDQSGIPGDQQDIGGVADVE